MGADQTPAQSRRTVRLHIDLTGSNCGPEWNSVALTLRPPDDWTDERIRQGAADHYAIPLDQVSEPRRISTSSRRDLEIYEDEWGTFWLPYFNLSYDDAIRRVREVYGEDGEMTARRVRGRVLDEDGESSFELDDAGPDSMWEVQAGG